MYGPLNVKYVLMYIHTHTYIHTYIYIRTCLHTHSTFIHNTHIRTYSHTHTHTHTYIHTYIHTYTHTYTLFLEIIHENLKFFAASMYFYIEDQTENNFTKIDAILQYAKDGRMLIATHSNSRSKTWHDMVTTHETKPGRILIKQTTTYNKLRK